MELGLLLLSQEFLELARKVDERNAKDTANVTQFEQVQTPRARFVITYERLWLAKFAGHIYLSKTRLQPELAQERQQRLLLFPVCRQAWPTLVHSARSIEA